jgi:tetratricopeptide (TPR) repeat protein
MLRRVERLVFAVRTVLSSTMRKFAIVVLSASSLAIAHGATAPKAGGPSFVYDRSLTDEQRYDHCLKLAKIDPDTAYEDSLQWHDAGGGAAAVHCSALALIQLKHYDAAAVKLDELARARDTGSPMLRAELLDQAGNAWMMAGQPENAEASLSSAIEMGDQSADVYSDRARARGLRKDWSGAEADLNVALSKDDERADLLVLRASARHALGDRKRARADIDSALEIDPGYVDALVERGAMKLEAGDVQGARSDWQHVLASQPNSPAADSAREHIEQLELGGKNSRQTTRH